jgi:hypothetical protein
VTSGWDQGVDQGMLSIEHCTAMWCCAACVQALCRCQAHSFCMHCWTRGSGTCGLSVSVARCPGGPLRRCTRAAWSLGPLSPLTWERQGFDLGKIISCCIECQEAGVAWCPWTLRGMAGCSAARMPCVAPGREHCITVSRCVRHCKGRAHVPSFVALLWIP